MGTSSSAATTAKSTRSGAANGRVLWSYDTTAPVRSRPFVTNDLVIVGSESGEVVALSLSGARKWSYRTRRGVISSPYVDMKEGICYVGSADGYMYAVDVDNGYQLVALPHQRTDHLVAD